MNFHPMSHGLVGLGLVSLLSCAGGSSASSGAPAGGEGATGAGVGGASGGAPPGASGGTGVQGGGVAGAVGSGGVTSGGAATNPPSGANFGGSDGANGGSSGNPEPECEGGQKWPGGKAAAVVLTYDDGLPSQLSNAVPALEQHGFSATFFLSENFANFEQRKAQYRALYERGFELAGHTVRHPCFGLDPELSTFDQASLEKELDDNIATLRALGVTGELTFAYPCGHSEYGSPKLSYVPLIQARFSAARGVNCCALAPRDVDLYDVNTYWPPEDATLSSIVSPIDEAIQKGALLVYGFHAVGEAPGEWSSVPQAAHDALVAYLAEKRTEVWVTTFGAATSYVRRCLQ